MISSAGQEDLLVGEQGNDTICGNDGDDIIDGDNGFTAGDGAMNCTEAAITMRSTAMGNDLAYGDAGRTILAAVQGAICFTAVLAMTSR
jgi:hypothetical protein